MAQCSSAWFFPKIVIESNLMRRFFSLQAIAAIWVIPVLFMNLATMAQAAGEGSPGEGLPASLPQEFLQWKFGLFLHFNLATFNDREWANGYEDPLTFAPAQLDCGQWADAAKAAGMNYAVLTVKHTEGYPLWPSAATRHDITAFKNFQHGKGDLVRDFVNAFRARGLKVGLYYCAPGYFDNRFGNRLPTNAPSLHGMPPEAAGDFPGFIKRQFTELLTQYGKIDLIWVDQYQVMLTQQQWLELKAHIHHLQPDCLVIANNSHQAKETDIYSFEYPVFKSEKGLPPAGNRIPSEVCDTIVSAGTWFWQPGMESKIRSAQDVVEMVEKCNQRNANYLLDVGPDRTGRIAEPFAARLREIGESLRARAKLKQSHP
jgi:alpha-L-fucosidase